MMTDDMIRSMKEQMTPSDDVVTDLLAKIAALDASPASSEHVVSFDDARIRKACEDQQAVLLQRLRSIQLNQYGITVRQQLPALSFYFRLLRFSAVPTAIARGTSSIPRLTIRPL